MEIHTQKKVACLLLFALSLFAILAVSVMNKAQTNDRLNTISLSIKHVGWKDSTNGASNGGILPLHLLNAITAHS